SAASGFQDLPLLGLGDLVHLRNELVGGLLQALLAPLQIVLGDGLLLLLFAKDFDRVATAVANGYPRLLAAPLHLFHKLLAPLVIELRNGQSDDRAIVAGVEPEIGLLNRFFDEREGLPIPRLDRDQSRLRRRDCREGIYRRRGSEIVDMD